MDGDQHLLVVTAEGDEDDDADVDVPGPHVLADVVLVETIGMFVFYIRHSPDITYSLSGS